MSDAPSVERQPRILLFTIQTSHPGSCRLPKYLKAAGFHVGVLGLPRSLILASSHADERFRLMARRFEPLIRASVERAFRSFRPDIVVPCDERAVSVVGSWLGDEAPALSVDLMQCLRRSLGSLETFSRRYSKIETLQMAREAGVDCPRDTVVDSLEACEAAAEAFGYPVVLKISHGAGGAGVVLCRDPAALRTTWAEFTSRYTQSKSLRRKLLRRDWFGEGHSILVQEYVAGSPAMSCASALDGRTLSVVSGRVSTTSGRMGPASVTTVCRDPMIEAATARMIARMGASGFISFDFVIAENGAAKLVECNPRPTQILHLAPLVGSDPARALKEALAGAEWTPPAAGRTVEVAFFPQEWKRDSASPALMSAYHDVPWDDPRLLRAILGKRPTNWLGRPMP
ncbi:ATP-grasp domain-containing protein [Aquibium microcysteis]|uniref:ATP-grasp domain-containing protein n=1 Tax=Aquibium microcysteis TaxID=675281 RepID=UPI00165CFD1E|nr:ATP-grasp domain-containing protein [Aquibium microcysteis]